MSKIVNFKTREVKDGGGGNEPPNPLSQTQEDMKNYLLKYIELVDNGELGCLVLAGLDANGVTYTPVIMCENTDDIYRINTLLQEMKGFVHEECLDGLMPLDLELDE